MNKEGTNMSIDEVADGFLAVANETMTRPIRSLTEAKGHDSSKHRLATFGGAGGQHAVAIAESLGIGQILIHRYSSCLSAYGMALADVVEERQEPDSTVWSDEDETRETLRAKMGDLKEKAIAGLEEQGFKRDNIACEEYLNMRYRGTESALMVLRPGVQDAKQLYDGDEWCFREAFVRQHQQEFGFTLPDRDILVDDVRVRGVGKSFRDLEQTVDEQLKEIKSRDVQPAKEYKRSEVCFNKQRQDTPIYKLEDLEVGDRIRGPAILADGTQSIVITPNTTGLIIKTHVVLNVGQGQHHG